MSNYVAGPVSATGSLMQGYSNANLADYNAAVANQSASTATAQGQEQANRSLVNSRKIIGGEQAAYGASGVSGGSALDVMRSSAAQGELNALTIKNNAAIKANSYQNEGNLDQYRASNFRTSGWLNAASGMLGAGGSAYSPSSSSGSAADALDSTDASDASDASTEGGFEEATADSEAEDAMAAM